MTIIKLFKRPKMTSAILDCVYGVYGFKNTCNNDDFFIVKALFGQPEFTIL